MSTATVKAGNGKQKSQATLEREVIATLRELGGQLVNDEDIEKGDRFVIPRSMSLRQASKYLAQKAEDDEEIVRVVRRFPYRPLDGAAATERAIRAAFGTLIQKEQMSFFGPNPPTLIDVEVAYGRKVQVPWGVIAIPAIPDTELNTHAVNDDELGSIFAITVDCKKKYRGAIEGFLNLVEVELRERSIYRGQAVDAGFSFLDLSRVDPARVVYAQSTYDQMEASVFAPIRYPMQLAAANVSMKSAVLLHGTFGTGKTLFAYLTAQECVKHGVTFIQVRPNQDDLQVAMQSARLYAPAVVFFEDLDTLASTDNESDHISGLLELFDGVRAKGVPVMAILTTNYPEKIHKGMVRPGRLDALIEITPPDREGIIRLCKVLVPEGLLDDGPHSDWEAVADAAQGYIPAFIDEGCKRAVKYSLVRHQGDLEAVMISTEDLTKAMEGLRDQYNRMMAAPDSLERDPLSVALRQALRQDALEEKLVQVHDAVV